MSEQPAPSETSIQAQIQQLAQTLRGSSSVDRDVRLALAELLDELSNAIKAPTAPPEELAHLAESAAQLAQTLHDQQDEGLVAKARARLGAAILQAEAIAPNAVGLARRVIDALASIGI